MSRFGYLRANCLFCQGVEGHFWFLLRNASSSQRFVHINNRIIIKWTNVLLSIPVVAMATSKLPVPISNEPATPGRARLCLFWPQLSLQLSIWTFFHGVRGHLSLSEKCGSPSRNSQVTWHWWLCNSTPAGHSRSFLSQQRSGSL